MVPGAAVLSHPIRDRAHEREASGLLSHGDEAPDFLTWEEATDGVRTHLMINETTEVLSYLT